MSVQWEVLEKIVEKVKRLDPYRIILFGSLSQNKAHENSDIDLLVLLDSEAVSQNYEEKMGNKLKVRERIYEESQRVPVDLLVYTKREYEIIKSHPNSLSEQIESTGRVLYEKDYEKANA